ncbi:MAG: hypothetical protein KDD45_16775, partial [Bdellovibrionales bacterium]|nr:hypothetical protein [Bdellovibrionales bacterium]
MIKSLVRFLQIIFFIASMAQADSGLVKGKVIFQDETIHMEFSGKKDWDYSIDRKDEKKKRFIQVLVDPLDAESKKRFLDFKSSLIKKVSIIPKQEDNKTLIQFQISQNLESFDYLVDDPSRLIIDLYEKPEARNQISKQTNKVEIKKTDKPDKTDKTVDKKV